MDLCRSDKIYGKREKALQTFEEIVEMIESNNDVSREVKLIEIAESMATNEEGGLYDLSAEALPYFSTELLEMVDILDLSYPGYELKSLIKLYLDGNISEDRIVPIGKFGYFVKDLVEAFCAFYYSILMEM